jgi:hypothetical protein
VTDAGKHDRAGLPLESAKKTAAKVRPTRGECARACRDEDKNLIGKTPILHCG